MEKRVPHYSLKRVKALIHEGAYRVTRTALACAVRDFGYADVSQLATIVLGLEMKHFHKSMTTLHDPRLWQDVYHPSIEGVHAYVKVQIVDAATVVISFKAKEDD